MKSIAEVMGTTIGPSDNAIFSDDPRAKQIDPETPDARCPFCGRRLRTKGFIYGKVIWWSPVPEQCTCPQAMRREEEKQKAEADKKRAEEEDYLRKKIARLTGESGMNRRFQQRTFANFTVNEKNKSAYELCRKYADSFTGTSNDGKGLYLFGGLGTGKTHLAAAIANVLLHKGTAVICMTMGDLLARIRHTYDSQRQDRCDEAEVLRIYKEIPLLIVDDIGKEQATEWANSTIYSIVNARYESCLPMVITTNYRSADLIRRLTPKGQDTVTAEAIVDRMYEMCIGIPMEWGSYRRLQNAA